MLKEVVGNKINSLLISETKLDDTSPLNQFILEGFTPPYILDRTTHGGGLMLFVREDIPSKLLTNINPSGNIENIFFEINLRSNKWLISGSYNPNVDLIQNHTVNLSKNLHFYSSKYENFIVIGDFNAEITNNYLEEFCTSYNLKNLIKHVRCNQSPFMSKQLRKAIMTRTRLLDKYGKDNSAGNLPIYKRQRNFCVKLLRKSKKDFYNNLNVKRITNFGKLSDQILLARLSKMRE